MLLRKPLRLWPGVILAILQLLLWFAFPLVIPDSANYSVLGRFGGAFAIFLWWVLLSRAPWTERLGAVGAVVLALYAASHFLHESIANGAMGFLYFVLAVPAASISLVAAAVITRRLGAWPRRLTMFAAILLGCGMWCLLRTGGLTAEFQNDLHWRWTSTPEDRLLAQPDVRPAPPPGKAAGEYPAKQVERPAVPRPGSAPKSAGASAATPVAAARRETGGGWPGFRGPNRDSIVSGVRIDTDWTKAPPAALWRRPVGPGWSSFAVRGGLVYTQEQRGPDEVVACYSLSAGQPVWAHRDATRFWESNGGAGPRSTPALDNGRVYTLGATGILNALDAGDGSVVWTRAAAADTGTKVPQWGFAGSPLVVGDLVVVAAAGRLAAYDIGNGKVRWLGSDGGGSYSSPQLFTLDGIAQVLLVSDSGAVSVAPAEGNVLWKHLWAGSAIVQPALTTDHGILIATASASGGIGIRRLAVGRGADGWTVEERWTTTGLKPYFNDFVVHKDHAFGFDGGILSCIDLEDGSRKWKGGRYGYGQLVLLPDQDLLLVLTEEGELALVRATPDQFTELARAPAIEGKTWNHPVLAGNILLVRNDHEMAAFRLTPAAR